MAGFCRHMIGATFEGENKDEDGGVWVDAEIEGIDSDVSARQCGSWGQR